MEASLNFNTHNTPRTRVKIRIRFIATSICAVSPLSLNANRNQGSQLVTDAFILQKLQVFALLFPR